LPNNLLRKKIKYNKDIADSNESVLHFESKIFHAQNLEENCLCSLQDWLWD